MPIIAVLIDKAAEVALELLVYIFCLAIGTWLVGGREGGSGAQGFEQRTPEAGCEAGIPIGDDFVRQPEAGVEGCCEELGRLFPGNGCMAGNGNHVLCFAVDNSENTIKSLAGPSRWEAGDEVNADTLKGSRGDWKWL